MESRIGSSGSSRSLLVVGFGFACVMNIMPVEAQEMCGGTNYPFPYTDVSSVGAAFCPGIMEAYVTGVSKGTTPTTFSPNETVTRVQMTTFLQRSLDQGLTRGNRRAALNQWATPSTAMQAVAVGGSPGSCAADGEYIWASTFGQVIQVQASTGKIVGTWTGATHSFGVTVALGKVFAVDSSNPGELLVIDPTLTPGAVTVSANPLGSLPNSIAYDGTNLWTANFGGSVSIIGPEPPYAVFTFGGFTSPGGVLYDGAHIWVTDSGAGTLLEFDPLGNVVLSVPVGADPGYPVFDGANIWVPNFLGNSVTVVQASSGNVVSTITANATNLLNGPISASFDGERVLVTNFSGGSISLFKAADLSFIANISTGVATRPDVACSDGVNFWVPLQGAGNLLRF